MVGTWSTGRWSIVAARASGPTAIAARNTAGSRALIRPDRRRAGLGKLPSPFSAAVLHIAAGTTHRILQAVGPTSSRLGIHEVHSVDTPLHLGNSRMTVRHWSRSEPSAGPRMLLQRHHMDYTIAGPEVRSVERTAVSWKQDDPAADDATAAGYIWSGSDVGAGTSARLRHDPRVERKARCSGGVAALSPSGQWRGRNRERRIGRLLRSLTEPGES
jgi:hypothetical protein